MGFIVRQEVMDKIRPMNSSDISRVAELHCQAMGNSLWAQLGHPFLCTIYQALLSTSEFIAFVYIEDKQIEGFIAGSRNTKQMMKKIFRNHFVSLGFATLRGLRHRAVLKRLLETPQYFSRSQKSLANDILAESLFCSFTPKLRGKRISGHINKVLFDQLYAEGHQKIKITTETNNKGANRQLQSWGFVSKGTFQFYGKDMVTYVLDFTKSDRVEKSRSYELPL